MKASSSVLVLILIATSVLGQDLANPAFFFPELDGFPFYIPDGKAGKTSPSVGDIDGDGDLEIGFGTSDGKVFMLHHDGTLVSGWPIDTPSYLDGYATPALVDIDHDGDLEISVTCNTSLYAWHHDASPVDGFPVDFDYSVVSKCSPAIGDLDGDGDLEIVHGAIEDPCLVFAWHHDGSCVDGWPVLIPAGYMNHCSIFYSVTLADLDRDGRLEVLVATQGGQIYILRYDGSDFPGWPKEDLEPFDKCSPVVGDIDGDGEVEIVIGGMDGSVYAWDVQGNEKPGWPINPEGSESIWGTVLTDVTGDEALEVIISYHTTPRSIYVIDGASGTALPGWPQPDIELGLRCGQSVAVSDIDNDGEREIVAATYDGCFNWTCHGYILAFNPDGSMLPGFPISLGIQRPHYQPCIVDLDQDGDLEICVVTDWGYLLAGDCYLHVWDLPDPIIEDQNDWSAVYHDFFNTNIPGFILPTEEPIGLNLSPDTVTVSRGSSFDLTATFTNRNVIFQSFNTAIFLRLPNGEPYPDNPLIGPVSFQQKMLTTQRFMKSFSVSQNAPLGDYRILLPAGKSVHNIMDMDSTIVHVVE